MNNKYWRTISNYRRVVSAIAPFRGIHSTLGATSMGRPFRVLVYVCPQWQIRYQTAAWQAIRTGHPL
jgi:hypothetical protein